MAAPRKYPLELKERALRLWRPEQPRRPIAHVARELGLNPETLRTWIRQDEADRGERGDRPTTAEVEELRRLRKENLELRRANEILKATPAPDLVGRDFTAPAPNRLWVADISRIPTGEGPLWLASVRDAFSRRIVGWKASDRADTELVLGALEYAVWGRGLDGDPAQRRLIHHSDRGAQYTAIRFTQRLADAGIQPSMGSIGDSFDNALAENFFSTLKVERVYRTSYRTREEAELDIFRFIDGWYNPHRIQRELGWLSPDEYEEAYYRESAGSLTSFAGAR